MAKTPRQLRDTVQKETAFGLAVHMMDAENGITLDFEVKQETLNSFKKDT